MKTSMFSLDQLQLYLGGEGIRGRPKGRGKHGILKVDTIHMTKESKNQFYLFMMIKSTSVYVKIYLKIHKKLVHFKTAMDSKRYSGFNRDKN